MPQRAPSATAAPSRARRVFTTCCAYVFFVVQRANVAFFVTVFPPDVLIFFVTLTLLFLYLAQVRA